MNTERTHRVASMLSWWVARRRESTSSTCGSRNADLSASSHSTPSVPCCAACEEGTSIPLLSEGVMAQVDGMGRIASLRHTFKFQLQLRNAAISRARCAQVPADVTPAACLRLQFSYCL